MISIKTIYCDGSGTKIDDANWICICVSIPDQEDKYSMELVGYGLTNNESNWLALTAALRLAEDGDIVYIDNELLLKYLKGEYQSKIENLQNYIFNAKSYYDGRDITVKLIQREQNLAGICLDKGIPSSIPINKFDDMPMDNSTFRKCLCKLISKFEELNHVSIKSIHVNRTDSEEVRGCDMDITAMIN